MTNKQNNKWFKYFYCFDFLSRKKIEKWNVSLQHQNDLSVFILITFSFDLNKDYATHSLRNFGHRCLGTFEIFHMALLEKWIKLFTDTVKY